MIVDLTKTARRNLREIGDWIEQDDPLRAASFVDELLAEAHALATSFSHYPRVDSNGHLSVRRKNYRGYRIFYTVDRDVVTILNIHHGGRGHPDFS